MEGFFLKVTIVDEEKKKPFFLSPILCLLLGIVLCFFSNELIIFLFRILGLFVILYGFFPLFSYFKVKKEWKMVDNSLLRDAVGSFLGGILLVFLSNFFASAIQVVTGIWLFFIGLSKLSSAMYWKNSKSSLFYSELLLMVLFFILGFYTIFFENVVFVFIGALLIVSSILELIQEIFKK